MKKISFFLLFIFGISLYSCDLLESTEGGLSSEEIAQGLKTALEVGADTSVTITSAIDGFYGDENIKIPLPPQADMIVNFMNMPVLQSVGMPVMVENVILRVNRAAEDAAVEAKPILKDAITNISFSDAMSILQGQNPASNAKEFDSAAATHYLFDVTSTQLVSAFSPKIDVSLNKPIVGGVSTNESWETCTNTYNQVANTLAGQLLGLQPVDVSLGEFVTQKALDGLFVKVADEERKIRRDPFQWALDILHKVFGS